jgi:LacI family transcriptional regulator
MSAKRRVTSHEVAERAGVSRTTVSFVLNEVEGAQISEETRRRVFQAARELGYVPDAAARSLASGQTRTLGLVICQPPDHILVDAYLPQVMGASKILGNVEQIANLPYSRTSWQLVLQNSPKILDTPQVIYGLTKQGQCSTIPNR